MKISWILAVGWESYQSTSIGNGIGGNHEQILYGKHVFIAKTSLEIEYTKVQPVVKCINLCLA